MPSNRARDPITSLTAKELDDRKRVAVTAMRRTADLANTKAKQVIEAGYCAAHLGVMRAATEDEVDRIESDWAKAVLELKAMLNAFDDA